MLKNSYRELIWGTVLGRLNCAKEREKEKSQVIDSYMDMLWEVLLTDTERKIFQENPSRVNLAKKCLKSSGINCYQFIFIDKYYGLDLDTKEPAIDRYSGISYTVYSNWDDFYTKESINQKYFKPLDLVKKEYEYSTRNYVDKTFTEIWIPDIEFGIFRDKEGKGDRFIQRGECANAYTRLISSKEDSKFPRWYEKDYPQVHRFIQELTKYIDLCRKICRIIGDIEEFLSLDAINITYLRKNFPELIEGIKFS